MTSKSKTNKPKKKATIKCDENIYLLGGAIIEQAAKDYISAIRLERKIRKMDPAIKTKRTLYLEKYPNIYGKRRLISPMFKDCELFFESDYGNSLLPNIDTKALLNKLKELNNWEG